MITQLRRLLNPIQVWDLADGGPGKVIESFSVLGRLRILVCGGDGTVSWIISELEKNKALKRWPPIAILPLDQIGRLQFYTRPNCSSVILHSTKNAFICDLLSLIR